MNILVCFKVSRAVDALTQEEWQTIIAEGMEMTYLKQELGCFDEAALEQGLRLADDLKAAGQDCRLTAVTVGGPLPGDLMKNLYAVGYQQVCRLDPQADTTQAPAGVARLLADFVRRAGGFDLILTGQQAVGGDHGQTHWLLAEQLGLPVLTHLLSAAPQGQALGVRYSDAGRVVTALVQTPVVLAVENADHPYLRMATLRERMAVSQRTAQEEAVPLPLPPLAVERIWREDRSRRARLLAGETTAQKVEQLWDELLGEVLS